MAGADYRTFSDLLKAYLEVLDLSHCARLVHIIEEACLVELWLQKFPHQWVLPYHLLFPSCRVLSHLGLRFVLQFFISMVFSRCFSRRVLSIRVN